MTTGRAWAGFWALALAEAGSHVAGQLAIVVAAGTMMVTAVITGVLAYVAPLVGGAAPAPLRTLTPRVAAAAITLGVLNTFVAYLIFHSIIARLGASRASMVTCAIPAVGLALGTVFLDEPFDLQLLAGAVMIVGSIGVGNRRW